MDIQITALIENSSVDKNLAAEHGLSVLVRTGQGSLLFDTGSSDAFLANARKLSEEVPGSIEHVLLSHNHYDHAGGLTALLEAAQLPMTVHTGRGFFSPKFSKQEGKRSYHHAFTDETDIRSMGHRVKEHLEDTYELMKDVYIITNFPRDADPNWENHRFLRDYNGKEETDPFDDEISLVIRTSEGLLLLVGCSHPGILNIIAAVNHRFSDPLHTVIGGTHLVAAQGERLQYLIRKLTSMQGIHFGLSHCTGNQAWEALNSAGAYCFPFHAGSRITFKEAY